MGTNLTRATIIWFIGAMVLGAAAALLHLYRSALGGGGAATFVAVLAFACTALTVVFVYCGIMVAAREQDATATRFRAERDVADRLARWEGLRPRDR